MNWLRRVLRAAFPAGCPELDLHGLRVSEALVEVERFVARAEQQAVGEVRIVCGKGRHSPSGVGVLRLAVPGWLDAHGYAGRYRREVDRDGRDGALRVVLRR
ncbi:MAG: Smr/MutS family protein [Deferrisomatales bacterium]|nr:Smr/MutS family protein [Deferrisomatales bacterium]